MIVHSVVGGRHVDNSDNDRVGRDVQEKTVDRFIESGRIIYSEMYYDLILVFFLNT